MDAGALLLLEHFLLGALLTGDTDLHGEGTNQRHSSKVTDVEPVCIMVYMYT
jgi:hypothetical protein